MRLANRWQKRLDPRASTYSSSLLVGCQHREWLIWCRTKAVLADQPLGRVATPDEVAQVVTYCTLDAPASMTGAILDVNGASYLRT